MILDIMGVMGMILLGLLLAAIGILAMPLPKQIPPRFDFSTKDKIKRIK